MTDSRYQFQPRWTKAYRWLRFKPYYAVRAWLAVACWISSGGRIPKGMEKYLPSRRAYAGHLCSTYQALAAYKMQDYYTTPEIITELQKTRAE